MRNRKEVITISPCNKGTARSSFKEEYQWKNNQRFQPMPMIFFIHILYPLNLNDDGLCIERSGLKSWRRRYGVFYEETPLSHWC